MLLALEEAGHFDHRGVNLGCPPTRLNIKRDKKSRSYEGIAD